MVEHGGDFVLPKDVLFLGSRVKLLQTQVECPDFDFLRMFRVFFLGLRKIVNFLLELLESAFHLFKISINSRFSEHHI